MVEATSGESGVWRRGGGVSRDACHQSIQFFVHFHAVLAKIMPNHRLAPPPPEIDVTRLGNPGSATDTILLFSE